MLTVVEGFQVAIAIKKMLFLIGLGLADETDITVKGLQIVKAASRVYLEAYTSILLVSRVKLVRLWFMNLCSHTSLISPSVGSILWPPDHIGGSRVG